MQELDLMIHYRPGKLNQSADCLSRCLQSDCTQEDPSENTLHNCGAFAQDCLNRESTQTAETHVVSMQDTQPAESQVVLTKDREGLTLN